jgi:hypothetical protein
MVIKKDGTRKIIALLAIMALLVSSSIALAQGVDGDEVDPTKQEEPGEYNGPGDGPGDEPGEEPGEEPGDEPGEEPGEEPDEEPGEEPGEDEEPDEGEEADEDEEPGGDEEPGEDEELGGDEEPDEEPDRAGESRLNEGELGKGGTDDLQNSLNAGEVEPLLFFPPPNIEFNVKVNKPIARIGEEVEFTYEIINKDFSMFVWYELDDIFGEVASGSDFWWEKNDSIIKTRKHTITEADGNLLINEVKLEIWNLRSLLNHGKHNKTVSVNIIHPSIEVTKTASPSR